MADIYSIANKTGQPVAKVQDGRVYSHPGHVLLGYVNGNSVADAGNHHLGDVNEHGEVVKGSTPAGHVDDQGQVFDHTPHRIGKVVGEPRLAGAAALLLLLHGHEGEERK